MKFAAYMAFRLECYFIFLGSFFKSLYICLYVCYAFV